MTDSKIQYFNLSRVPSSHLWLLSVWNEVSPNWDICKCKIHSGFQRLGKKISKIVIIIVNSKISKIILYWLMIKLVFYTYY